MLSNVPSQRTRLIVMAAYGLMETIEHWRKVRPGETFKLIHDQSKMIERHKDRWLAILDPENPPAKVGQDRRTIEFPWPVAGLTLAESSESIQLQIADLVAGAACEVLRAKARDEESDYSTALLNAGIVEAAAGGVWPGTAISPEELETVGPSYGDSAEHIGKIVKRHS